MECVNTNKKADGASTLKLLETLQTELKNLCLHVKKKHPYVRDVSRNLVPTRFIFLSKRNIHVS